MTIADYKFRAPELIGFIQRRAVILLAFIPVAAALTVLVLQELIAPVGSISCCPEPTKNYALPRVLPPEFAAAVYGMIASWVLFVILSAAATVYGIWAMIRLNVRWGWFVPAALAVVVYVIVFKVLDRSVNTGATDLLFREAIPATVLGLELAGDWTLEKILEKMGQLGGGGWMFGALFLLPAAAATASVDVRIDGYVLRRRVADQWKILDGILYVGAALLVVGLIFLNFHFELPRAFYVDVPHEVESLVGAQKFRLAILYSLILALIYTPPALVLTLCRHSEMHTAAPSVSGRRSLIPRAVVNLLAVASPILTNVIGTSLPGILG